MEVSRQPASALQFVASRRSRYMIRGHFGVELVASRSQPAINEDGRRQVVDHLWAGGEREPSACLPCPLMPSQQLTTALPPPPSA